MECQDTKRQLQACGTARQTCTSDLNGCSNQYRMCTDGARVITRERETCTRESKKCKDDLRTYRNQYDECETSQRICADELKRSRGDLQLAYQAAADTKDATDREIKQREDRLLFLREGSANLEKQLAEANNRVASIQSTNLGQCYQAYLTEQQLRQQAQGQVVQLQQQLAQQQASPFSALVI